MDKSIFPESKLTKKQVKEYHKNYRENGRPCKIIAKVRFDDECGNGHNTFAITADIYEQQKNSRWICIASGCCHDDIAKHFPKLRPLIKWHLCSTDGPMHYVANTLFQAGDKDCWGMRKDEFRQHTSRGQQNNGVEGVPNWVLEIPKGIKTDVYAETCPEPVLVHWKPWGQTGKGKERKLNHARNSAIWPEATDEELTAPDLKQRLLDRLPALMLEFKAAVESLGFTY